MARANDSEIGDALERLVVASVAITARALGEVAPELTFLQWRVLVLVDTPDGMPVGPIATALGAKIAAVSRLITRLRERGLVETRRSEADARVVVVCLSRDGAALRQRVVESRRAQLEGALGRAQLPAQFDSILARLASALETIEE